MQRQREGGLGKVGSVSGGAKIEENRIRESRKEERERSKFTPLSSL